MIRSRWRGLAPTACLLPLTFIRLDYRPVVIVGHSMEPTLLDRDIAWMRQRRTGDAPLSAGDIVVLRYRNDILVKRVAATGGQSIRSIQLAGGGTEILETNGPSAPWTKIMLEHIRRNPRYYLVSQSVIPSGCIYVVGDNEPASWDSRDIGPVPESSVLGVITPSQDLAVPDLRVANVSMTQAR